VRKITAGDYLTALAGNSRNPPAREPDPALLRPLIVFDLGFAGTIALKFTV